MISCENYSARTQYGNPARWLESLCCFINKGCLEFFSSHHGMRGTDERAANCFCILQQVVHNMKFKHVSIAFQKFHFLFQKSALFTFMISEIAFELRRLLPNLL